MRFVCSNGSNDSSSRTSTAILTATVAIVASLVSVRPAAAQLVPGDILLDNANAVQHYNAAGTSLPNYTGTGLNYEGASITPGGNIATTYRGTGSGKGGVVIYRPNGTQLTTFSTPTVSFPGDTSVFADGTLAISDQNSLARGATAGVRLYSQTGSFIRSLTAAGMNNPFGNMVAPDNTLYLADVGANKIFHFSETGFLGSFDLTFSPGDLVVSPLDGTLFISDVGSGAVVQTTTTGAFLKSFASGVSSDFNGIGISGDGLTIFAVGAASTTIRKMNSATGAFISEFAIRRDAFPGFLTVVPNSSVAAPEQGSLSLLLPVMGTVGMVFRKRRKK